MLASVISGQGIVDLFDFDRCAGTLSNHRVIDISDSLLYVYTCEFSPSQNLLYVSGWNGLTSILTNLYQYDLMAANISGSRTSIWESPNFMLDVGQLQIAPDNKIYYTSWFISNQTSDIENKYLSVINSPDSLGLACDFQPFSFYLGDSSWTTYALPNMPNYNLGPVGMDSCITGVEVKEETMAFRVYPNPTSGLVNIECAENNSCDQYGINIFNVTGQKIYHITSVDKKAFALSHLQPGIYFYTIQLGSSVSSQIIQTGKLIVSH